MVAAEPRPGALVRDLGTGPRLPIAPGLSVARAPEGALVLWVVRPGRIVRRFVLAAPLRTLTEGP